MKTWMASSVPLVMVNFVLWFYLATVVFSDYVRVDYV